MKILSVKNDFTVESGVVMNPLQDRVEEITGYDPEAPLGSLGFDPLKLETYQEKEAIAKKAELLEARIASTISTAMSKEERETTMPDRYDKLVQAIKDYHNSDEAIQVYLTQPLNRAIRSMNSEFAPVDARIVRDFEKTIVDKMRDVQELSVTAHKELIDLFADYKKLDPNVQRSVLPEVKDLYKSYMNSNIDSAEVKAEVMRAYHTIPKTFNPNISFDLSALYEAQHETEAANTIRERLDAADVEKMSFSDLSTTVEKFQSYDMSTKAELYDAYCGLIDDYKEAHPKSTNAVELRLTFREQYYELVRDAETQDIIDTCRLINATTTAASRDANIGLANEILEDYSKLSDNHKELVRPIVIDSVEEFNSFELKSVVAPAYREPVQEDVPAAGRYSSDYYVVRDQMSDPSADKAVVVEQALALDLKEQAQLMNLSVVKNTPEYMDALSGQVMTAREIQNAEAGDWDPNLARAFVKLTPNNRDLIFDDVIAKFPSAKDYAKCAEAVPELNASMKNAFETYYEYGDAHSFAKYCATIRATEALPEKIRSELSENTMDYYRYFADAHKTMIAKGADVYEAFLKATETDPEELDYALGYLKDNRDERLREYEHEKTVAKLEAGLRDIDAPNLVRNFNKFAELYEKNILEDEDIARLYPLARAASETDSVLAAKLTEMTEEDSTFDHLNLIYDMAHTDPTSLSRDEMRTFIERYAELDSTERFAQAEEFNTFYVAYADAHPRIAADSDVKDTYFAAMKETSRLGSAYASSFNDTIRSAEGLSASFVNKKLNEFDELPVECKGSAFSTVSAMYREYVDGHKTPTLNERFEKLVETAAMANPEMTKKFLDKKFESETYANAYHRMSASEKIAIYKELDALCTEAGISHQGFSGNVASRYEEVTDRFAQEAIEAGQCREQMYRNAARILTSDRSNEDYEAFIRDCTARTVETGGVQLLAKMRYESAFMGVCSEIEKDIEARIAHQKSVEDFKQECKDLSNGIDLRQRVNGTRNVDQLDRTVAEVSKESNGAREYAAMAYVNKVDKFYNSSTSAERFYLSSYVLDGDGSSRKIFMEIDKVIGPNCVIAKAPNSDECYLVLTQDKIDIGVSREERDIYSALSGSRIVKANDSFNDNVMFSFNRDGKMVVTFPTPEQKELDDNYKPANYAVRQSYEIQNVERDGIQTVITAFNPATGDHVEILTRLKENEIVRRTRTDVIIGDTGNIAFAQGKDVLLDASAHAIADHREAVRGTRAEIAVGDEPIGGPDMSVLSGGAYNYKSGKLYAEIDGRDCELTAMRTTADNRTLLNYRDPDTGDVKYIMTEDSYKDVVDKAFDNAVAKCEPVPESYSEFDLSTYQGEVCVKYVVDGAVEFAPVCDIRNVDGKAVVSVLDTDETVKTVWMDGSYEDVARTFASKFERTCYIEEVPTSDLGVRFERVEGRIYATVADAEGEIMRGAVVNVSSNGVCINCNDGLRMLTEVEDIADKVKIGSNVNTGVYAEDGRVTIVSGRGNSYSDVMHPDSSAENNKAVVVQEYKKDSFFEKGLSEGHRGNEVYLSWENAEGKIATDKVAYVNAEYSASKDLVDLIVVTDGEKEVNAFAVRDLTVNEFRKVVEQVKVEEQIKEDFEGSMSLQNVNSGTYSSADVEIVIDRFNHTVGRAITVSEVKPIQEEGDIVRASVVEKDGSYVLRGIDHSGKSIAIQNPVMRFEGDEMFAYGASADESNRNRIVSSAFGCYTSLRDLAAQQSFNYRLVLDGKENLNHIISGVEFEKKVEWSLNETASSIRELYTESVGLSCSAADGHKLGAGQLALGEDIQVSSGYGVLVTEGRNGPHFTYCNPDNESNLKFLPTLQSSNKFLLAEEVPTSAEDAKVKQFVLVDYDLGVAIKDGGMVYRVRQSDIPEAHGPNFYDPKILDSNNDLAADARFVSASKFDTGKDDYAPSVNKWEINISSSGRPILSFAEADFHRSLGDLASTYEVSKVRVSENGSFIEAELVSPIANSGNTSGSISTVRLCAPSEDQIRTMENATEHTIGSANEKLQHYFSQVNELASGYILHGEIDHSQLGIGQYLVVKNDPEDKFGVMYKVCGENGEMLIVGGADNSAKHPTMYADLHQLAGKDVTLVNPPETVDQDMRWAKSTVYISDLKMEKDGVSFSYGPMDLLHDTTGGPTCHCSGEKLDSKEPVVDTAKEMDREVAEGFDFTE